MSDNILQEALTALARSLKTNGIMRISTRIAPIFTICFVATLLDARASALYSGSISGTFSNPVFSGYGIDLNGNPITQDNSSTANYTGLGSNFITWGAVSPGFPSSILTFAGNSFSGIAPGQDFNLGTIIYFNGTSSFQSLIFGASLTLTVNSTQGGTVNPAVSNLGFVSTENRQPAPNSVPADADFVLFDPLLPVSFNVFEGATASAYLFGAIVGDPNLTITGIQLGPGQENNGFIGHGQPSIPDTASTLSLMGLALLALAATRAAVPRLT